MHRKHLVTLSATIALLVAPACALGAGPPASPGGDQPNAALSITPSRITNPGTANKPVGTPARDDHPSGDDHATGPENPGSANEPVTPGPGASAEGKAKAYGTYCRTDSKKHIDGHRGTPFSMCVTAMAKLATGRTSSPTAACKALSKVRVDGQTGTPFSKCVSGAAKLFKDERAADSDSTDPVPADPGS
jgi:hypothetical protein